jgi:hypothetical protein
MWFRKLVKNGLLVNLICTCWNIFFKLISISLKMLLFVFIKKLFNNVCEQIDIWLSKSLWLLSIVLQLLLLLILVVLYPFWVWLTNYTFGADHYILSKLNKFYVFFPVILFLTSYLLDFMHELVKSSCCSNLHATFESHMKVLFLVGNFLSFIHKLI